MATNPLKKPPENDTQTTVAESSSGPTILLKQQRSTCSCSNISIMQLFHEMKQKFPTVPDHVVSELVTANCHNRPACIDSLEKAVLGTPAAAQAYPSQSIHSSSLKRRINERKLNKLESSLSGGSSGSSSRESSVDKTSKCMGDASGSNFVSANNSINNNNNRIPNTTTTIVNGSTGDLSRDGGSVNNTADNHPMTTVFDNNNNRIAPSRPTTLPFSGPRPTRVAPLPPISSSQTTSSELGETINVQLNVTVSPVASRSPIGQRHTSILQLQPEPPYSRELAQASSRFNTPGPLPAGANSRSSTSVNLTLRQPSEGPQSPIHIHASPLKYTAKGFNAQSGIQSKLEITFRDGFGSISAMRTHVPGYDQPIDGSSSNNSSSNSNSIPQHGQLQENPYRDHQQMTAAQVATTNNESDGLTKEQLRQNYLTEVAITHQVDQKNRLSFEVDRYRQQLKSLRREIGVLQRPLSPQVAENLYREVQFLLEEAAQMQKEVDSAELTANPGITDGLHALSIEGSPVLPGGSIVNRPPRPPRPPPPRIPPGLHQQLPPGAAAAVTATSSYTIEGRYLGQSMSAPAAGPNDPSGGSGGGGDTSTGEQWTCSLCTFQNHELMTTCEVCSLPKVSVVTSGQDIHIYLSPGQNKIIHSWIVS
ncbi:type-2 histone deacetylase 1 isoform X2 [Ochlerotatus camptorhynchus]|uniref:type-2 histone deacetylase 1 isoform X2 n=1 Tax=Ochlerotatus camptorhynchus TaxID=644619 RepID=UPI0031E1C4B1